MNVHSTSKSCMDWRVTPQPCPGTEADQERGERVLSWPPPARPEFVLCSPLLPVCWSSVEGRCIKGVLAGAPHGGGSVYPPSHMAPGQG